MSDHVTVPAQHLEELAMLRQRIATLQGSEAHYQTLVEQSLHGISITRHGRRLFANRAFATMFEYDTPTDMIGQHAEANVAPHERARIEAYRQARARGEPAPSRYELQGVTKDGACLWVENTVTDVSWDGEPAVMSIVVDITARRQAETLLARRARQQAAVAALGQQALAQQPLDQLMADAVAQAVHTLDVEYGKVLELLPDGAVLLLRVGQG
jgi:PAS domain S-box-containing protein